MAILKVFTAIIAALSLGVVAAPAPDNNAQKDKYIITLKKGISSNDVETHVNWAQGMRDASLRRRALDLPGIERYDIADFHAYSGSFDDETIQKITDSPEVLGVEHNMEVIPMALTTQQNPPWGLSAMSSRTQGSQPYQYDDSAGKDTFAYVMDTGINANHVEFGGRAELGYNAEEGEIPDEDRTGHGTQVAGIIGSNTYGVAKKANIIAVKSRWTSSMLKAYAWAILHIQNQGRVGRAVINVSGGYGRLTEPGKLPSGVALARIMETAFNEGILTVIAAGNDGRVVEESDEPFQGNSTSALVVGAVDEKWNFARWSNHGSSVDILAPGDNIMTTDKGSDTATTVQSGTSLSAPYVTGLALYLIAAENIKTAADLRARILALATKDKVTSVPANTVKLLAYNGA